MWFTYRIGRHCRMLYVLLLTLLSNLFAGLPIFRTTLMICIDPSVVTLDDVIVLQEELCGDSNRVMHNPPINRVESLNYQLTLGIFGLVLVSTFFRGCSDVSVLALTRLDKARNKLPAPMGITSHTYLWVSSVSQNEVASRSVALAISVQLSISDVCPFGSFPLW